MTVLVAYTPTPEGRAAVERAVAECRTHGAPLVVLISHPGRPDVPAPTVDEAEVRGVLADLGADDLRARVTPGAELLDPADQVLVAAEEVDARLIVMGLRRRTPVGKLILGSMAQRILLDAPCPVLAVKAAPRLTLPGEPALVAEQA